MFTTECIGIATEKMLCDIFKINFLTKRKSIAVFPNKIKESITNFLNKNNFSLKEHTGNLNKHHDFVDSLNKTVSVKTNTSGNKVCPQNIGQVSLKNFKQKTIYKDINTVDNYKKLVFNNTYVILNLYLEHLFCCDKMIYLNYSTGTIILFEKTGEISFSQEIQELLRFSKNLSEWKESTTIYYDNLSLGEFQVHSNRDCLKYRFNMDSILKNISSGKISGISYTIYNSENLKIKKDNKFRTFNYIGSKFKLLEFVADTVEQYSGKKLKDIHSVADLFAGTGIVSKHFLENGVQKVISADNQYYSSVVSSVFLDKCINRDKVTSFINSLNRLSDKETGDNNFIFTEYSVNRQYYTEANGLKIDKMRIYLENHKNQLTEQEYKIVLKTILYAATKTANITSVFGAFLKKPKASFLKPINLEEVFVENLINSEGIEHITINCDIMHSIEKSRDCEVVYLDPPYNQRNYSSNYHLLETIAKYDNPEIKGKTGLRIIDTIGAKRFCCKKTVFDEFSEIISKIKNPYLFISYNSDGLLKKEEFVKILSKFRTNVVCFEKEYKRFKSNSSGNQNKSVVEYIFCSSGKE